MNDLVTILIGLGFALGLIGVILFFPARRARKVFEALDSWPTAPGTILSDPAVQLQAGDPSDSKRKPLFEVKVRFQFRACGQMHYGETISIPRVFFEEKDIQRLARRYPADLAVLVHYNPENVQDCCLEIWAPSEARYYSLSILMLIFAVLMVVFGLVGIFGVMLNSS